ncbi:MAG TPA: TonB-dependent receptor [Gemmatimonadaceae bacterium]|nr:TonB-dependent receptor [Gemmatimonadaceae bacterium]
MTAVWVASLIVNGHVRDAVSRAPVEGVAVQVVGTAIGTLTDESGFFQLEAETGARLRFTRLGYAPVEIRVREAGELQVLLVPSARALEGVTIAALRAEGASGSAPITQRVLARDALDARYSGQEMPLLLTDLPSMTSYADNGAYSNYTYMRLRGIDQTRINITLDGVPLNDAEDQGVFFSNFPDFGNSLESVQIQRGIGTSSQGTAPYAGSINFESMALARAPRGGELQLSRGSYDTNRGSLEWHSGPLAERFALYGRASSQQTDGFRHHSGNRSAGGFLSAGYFGNRNTLKLTAFSGVSRNQESYLASPEGAIEDDPRHNPLTEAERDRFTQSMVSLAATRRLGSSANLSATAYTVGAGGNYDVLIGSDLWNFNLASRMTGGFATWSAQRGRLTLSAGAHGNDYWRDHALFIRPDFTTRLYLNTGHKSEVSTFAKVAYEIGEITLFGDLQGRRVWYRYEPDANAGVDQQSIDWSFLNPRIGVTWRVTSELAAYAFAGENGREPTRNDMFAGFDNIDTTNADFVGPLSRVRPERVRDTEVGLTYRTSVLDLGVNLYSMDFHNEITPIGALSYIGLPLRKNVHSSHRRGIEVDARYRAAPRLLLAGNLTLSRNRIAEYTDDATGQTYQDVEPLLTPAVVSNQSAELALAPSLTATLGGRYLSRSFLANTSDSRFVTPPAYTMDAGLTWRAGDVTLLAQIRNLTNARAYTSGYTDGTTSYFYVLARRNAIVTAKIGF